MNYVVIDLEMCNTFKSITNQKMRYRQELIQIGAVLLDNNYNVTDSFVTYVSPEFGKVDREINLLTGISKEDTQGAPTAREALTLFAEWLPEEVTIITWSRNDEKQIRSEFARKSFDVPAIRETFGSWIDCQEIFGNKLSSRKKYRLSEALSIADIFYDDGAHDALIDARNTARLFAKIQSDSFHPSSYFISGSNTPRYSLDPFASSYRYCS